MPDLIIGFDTEYRVRRPDDHIWLPGPRDNLELVRTACVMNPSSGRYKTLAHYPSGPTRRHRTGLVPFLGGCLLAAMEAGLLTKRSDRKYSVQLAAHFARADLPAFRDWPAIKKRFDSVRGTFCTMARPAVFTAQIPKLGRVRISVTLIDTILHAPATHRSLAKLGAALGFEKMELPPGAIERMDELLESDPELFEAYAIRDAVIAAKLVREMDDFYRATLGLGGPRFPVTLSSAGVRLLKKSVKEDSHDLADLLGLNEAGETSVEAKICNQIGAEAFHGGRNEAFWLGPTPEGVTFFDVDIAGAYSTILAAFRMPGWQSFCQTTSLKELIRLDEGMAFATIRFAFPDHTRFPSLPVRHKEGLFYPLRGETTVTGAELIVALDHGAEIEVVQGVFIPWAGNYRPLLVFTQRIQDIRQKATSGSLKERAAKEAGNSLYGKFAQAVSGMKSGERPSMTFDSRTGRDQILPPSKITQPCVAAWITGICRAVVSEMLARMPDTAIVCSVTTDGLLSSVPLEAMDLNGPLCRYFVDLRSLAAPGTAAFEIKHIVHRAYILRTRGALTIEPAEPRDKAGPLMARAGNRLSDEQINSIAEGTADPNSAAWAENDMLLEQAVTRVSGQKSEQRRKVTLKEQWQRETDLTMIGEPVEVAVSMDYDLKRQIVRAEDSWRGCMAAKTKPWRTLEDATKARDAYRRWRKAQQRVLRTTDDLRSLEIELATITGGPAEALGQGDEFAAAVRTAAANGHFGFPTPACGRGARGEGGGYPALAKALTECGVPTTRDQLNRARGKPPGNTAKIKPQHTTVYQRLRLRFPAVDWPAITEIEPDNQSFAGLADEHCQKNVRVQKLHKAISNQILINAEAEMCATQYPPITKPHTSQCSASSSKFSAGRRTTVKQRRNVI